MGFTILTAKDGTALILDNKEDNWHFHTTPDTKSIRVTAYLTESE